MEQISCEKDRASQCATTLASAGHCVISSPDSLRLLSSLAQVLHHEVVRLEAHPTARSQPLTSPPDPPHQNPPRPRSWHPPPVAHVMSQSPYPAWLKPNPPFWGGHPCRSCKGLAVRNSAVETQGGPACPLTQALVVGHIDQRHILLQTQALETGDAQVQVGS